MKSYEQEQRLELYSTAYSNMKSEQRLELYGLLEHEIIWTRAETRTLLYGLLLILSNYTSVY